MCGIVGAASSRNVVPILHEGIRRLEYRGYDSAGVATLIDGRIERRRAEGKLGNLVARLKREPVSGTIGIGHTRWATHGPPTDRNSHPHLGAEGRVAVVHNGIIENFAGLRAELESKGREMRSETDTEVVSHLLSEEYDRSGDLAEAMRAVCRQLEGAFTLVGVHADAPDVVVGARRNSPLVVGLGEGENFLGSDVAAFIEHTREAMELGQDQVVELRRDGVTVTTWFWPSSIALRV